MTRENAKNVGHNRHCIFSGETLIPSYFDNLFNSCYYNLMPGVQFKASVSLDIV